MKRSLTSDLRTKFFIKTYLSVSVRMVVKRFFVEYEIRQDSGGVRDAYFQYSKLKHG